MTAVPMAPGQHAAELQKWFASDQINKIMEGSEAVRRRKARHVYVSSEHRQRH